MAFLVDNDRKNKGDIIHLGALFTSECRREIHPDNSMDSGIMGVWIILLVRGFEEK